MDSNIAASGVATTASADRFYSIYNAGSGAATVSNGVASNNVFPIAGTLSNFKVIYDTTAGGGFTRTFAIYNVNGAADTAITFTIADGAVTGSDTTHSLSVSAGDVLSIRTSATGTTASTGNIRWTAKFTAAANTSLTSSSTLATVSATVTSYLGAMGANSDNASSQGVGGVMPTGGTIKNAYAQLSGAPGAAASGKKYDLTLVKNGTPTSLVVTVSETATTGSDTNGAHAVTVAAGDVLYWQCVPTSTPTARNLTIGAEFDPTTNGESVQMFGNNSAWVNSAARFAFTSGGSIGVNASEGVRQVITQTCTWRNHYLWLLTAPGAGTWQTQLDVNTVAGNPTVTIATVATTGNDTVNTISTTFGDTVSMKITPAVSPTLPTQVQYGFVTFMTPPAATRSLASTGVG